jgi:hypothetical protein
MAAVRFTDSSPETLTTTANSVSVWSTLSERSAPTPPQRAAVPTPSTGSNDTGACATDLLS